MGRSERLRASGDPAPDEVDRHRRRLGEPRPSQLLRRHLPALVVAVRGLLRQPAGNRDPRPTEILGHPVYPSHAALPLVPDLVDVFRRHAELPTVLEETLAVGARTLWLQLGSWHEEVARLGAAAGLEVVMDRCVKIEHARFTGGLHLAGFDTGVISSRRSLR